MIDMDGSSGCPINLTMELLGDRWSLVVLRDVTFGDRRTFSDLHRGSEEGIATNILGDRLHRLTDSGLLTRNRDPGHKQRIIHNLTEPAIQLVPLFAVLGDWGRRHLPVTEPLSVRAEVLADGGPALWAEFMDELRWRHLDIGQEPTSPTVADRLRAAYESAS